MSQFYQQTLGTSHGLLKPFYGSLTDNPFGTQAIPVSLIGPRATKEGQPAFAENKFENVKLGRLLPEEQSVFGTQSHKPIYKPLNFPQWGNYVHANRLLKDKGSIAREQYPQGYSQIGPLLERNNLSELASRIPAKQYLQEIIEGEVESRTWKIRVHPMQWELNLSLLLFKSLTDRL